MTAIANVYVDVPYTVSSAKLATVPGMSRRPDGRESGEVTGLLRAWSEGDGDAFEQVLPLVYDELHRIAARYLVGERSSVSLQATALVNELCLRLLGWDPVRWQNRQHFYGVSARMMRRVLVDIARRRRADRRGGRDAIRVTLEEVDVTVSEPGADVLAVDMALDRLALEDPRKAQVVELRFFGGLSVEETAEALGVSVRTVHTDWAFARAWLYRMLTTVDAH
jgi:RNA polymerase sigma-70 factor, ECF subfamily